MRNVRETELMEWAGQRADDAGRLARDVLEIRNSMIEVLEDCETYFDNKADADGENPNREMVLQTAVKKAIALISPAQLLHVTRLSKRQGQ